MNDTFSQKVKSELYAKNDCCKRVDLAFLIAGSSHIDLNKDSIMIKPEGNNRVYAVRLARELFGVVFKELKEFKDGFVMDSYDDAFLLLSGLELIDEHDSGRLRRRLSDRLLSRTCCKRQAIRAAFLAGGLVNNPAREFHLEIDIKHPELYGDVIKLMDGLGLTPKMYDKSGTHAVYFKSFEGISDFLGLVDAKNSLFEFMNAKIIKDKRNEINRRVNCETANLTKTVDAAFEQVKIIEDIERTVGLSALPGNLEEIARLRLQFRDASLKDLAGMLKISRSGVNHRFKKLSEYRR